MGVGGENLFYNDIIPATPARNPARPSGNPTPDANYPTFSALECLIHGFGADRKSADPLRG